MGLFGNNKNEINTQLDELEKKLLNNDEEIKMFDTSSLKGKLLERAKELNKRIYAKKNDGKSIPKVSTNDTKKSFSQQLSTARKDLYEEENKIICPNCHSTNLQFMQQDKKAFSIGKAAAGTILTGGVGALAGFAGKKGNKQWFCQNCNTTFETK